MALNILKNILSKHDIKVIQLLTESCMGFISKANGLSSCVASLQDCIMSTVTNR